MLVGDHHHALAGHHGSPRPLGRIVEKDDAAAVGSHSRALIKFGEISHFRTAFCYLPLHDSELSLIGGIHQRKLRLLTIVGQCGRERLLRDIQLVLLISAVEFELWIVVPYRLIRAHENTFHDAIERCTYHRWVERYQFAGCQHGQFHGNECGCYEQGNGPSGPAHRDGAYDARGMIRFKRVAWRLSVSKTGSQKREELVRLPSSARMTPFLRPIL